MKNISTKIKILRVINNLSQEDLASMIKTSGSTISNVENNKEVPTTKMIYNISELIDSSSLKSNELLSTIDSVDIYNLNFQPVNVKQTNETLLTDYFALLVENNSYYPVFQENDILIIKEQPFFSDNQIGAVYFNNKIYLNRLVRENKDIILYNINNNNIENRFSLNEQIQLDLKILGVVLYIKRKFV